MINAASSLAPYKGTGKRTAGQKRGTASTPHSQVATASGVKALWDRAHDVFGMGMPTRITPVDARRASLMAKSAKQDLTASKIYLKGMLDTAKSVTAIAAAQSDAVV